MDNLNSISLAYSPATTDIVMLGDSIHECRVIDQMFYDVLAEIARDVNPIEFNSRGKNYIVRVEQK
jgi:hypothetical protein